MHSKNGNTHVCESRPLFSAMKQVKSENRNRMAKETLDDSLRLATMNILLLFNERYFLKSHRHRTDRGL